MTVDGTDTLGACGPRRRRFAVLAAMALAAGCGGGTTETPDGGVPTDDGPVGGGDARVDAPHVGDGPVADVGPPADGGTGGCGFDYDQTFTYALLPTPGPTPAVLADPTRHGTRRVHPANEARPYRGPGDIIIPAEADTMPLFERGTTWTTATRCYETPRGTEQLAEAEAYDLYRRIAELTTGAPLDTAPEVRSVVGLRGSYPGRFAFNDNRPDRFNDTIVLLWQDAAGQPHVREFPVTNEPGPVYFGEDSSSAVRANRRYLYTIGLSQDYHVLRIAESAYPVRDDTNSNGHWDSDRNGWLPPAGALDHDRTGNYHHIHLAQVNAPLGSAAIENWTAGCHAIPGTRSWAEFITNVWTTGEGQAVSFYLVDVRDIDPGVWSPCAAADGTHACPFRIASFPFTAGGDTTSATERRLSHYNCSPADASGPEVVYLVTLDRGGTLTAAITPGASGRGVAVLDADDERSCLAVGNAEVSLAAGPGRYFVVVDTTVVGGAEQTGPFTLDVDFQ